MRVHAGPLCSQLEAAFTPPCYASSRLIDIGVEAAAAAPDKEASPFAQPYDAVGDIKDAVTL